MVLGLAAELGKAYESVAKAYSHTAVANHFLAQALVLYELSLNGAIAEEDRKNYQQASQLAAIFPETQTLPAVREALKVLGALR